MDIISPGSSALAAVVMLDMEIITSNPIWGAARGKIVMTPTTTLPPPITTTNPPPPGNELIRISEGFVLALQCPILCL